MSRTFFSMTTGADAVSSILAETLMMGKGHAVLESTPPEMRRLAFYRDSSTTQGHPTSEENDFSIVADSSTCSAGYQTLEAPPATPEARTIFQVHAHSLPAHLRGNATSLQPRRSVPGRIRDTQDHMHRDVALLDAASHGDEQLVGDSREEHVHITQPEHRLDLESQNGDRSMVTKFSGGNGVPRGSGLGERTGHQRTTIGNSVASNDADSTTHSRGYSISTQPPPYGT